ncbi:hypothetical protein XENOCAPTIV_007673 [Xenoophorus captivus]|uniref:G-patch domain-containing protein n=1 Tax=Xenoophorus captivus TaxID=1517983 RepID=A0ABV0RSP3_9TELE
MADCETERPVYLAISNVPAAFHSADLRNYFSQFIESGGFHCFHYRHRPEVQRDPEGSEPTVGEDGENASSASPEPRESTPSSCVSKTAVKSCCCVVSVRAKHADRFIRMYAGNHWIDSKGNWLARRCVIRRIRVSRDKGEGSFPYKTKYEQRHHVSLAEQFTEADLDSLPELNPPALMQNGNVGTPINVFLQLIQSCRLPPRLIRKLGLTFPKTGSSRRYGNVPFQYHNTCILPAREETVLTAAGHEISGPGSLTAPSSRTRLLADDAHTTEADDTQNEEEGEDARSNADDVGLITIRLHGFGRRVMEKQGWRDGEGLGSSQVGMPEALENEGQHPRCKRGFGYHGEKLVLHPVKRARTDFFISTVYDKPKDIDKGDTLLRRQPNTSMKYRGWQPGGSIGSKR